MRVGVHANNQKNTSINKHLKTKLILSCCPQYIMLSYTFILFVLSNKDIVMEQVDYCVSSPHSPSKLVSLLSLSLLVFDYPQDRLSIIQPFITLPNLNATLRQVHSEAQSTRSACVGAYVQRHKILSQYPMANDAQRVLHCTVPFPKTKVHRDRRHSWNVYHRHY